MYVKSGYSLLSIMTSCWKMGAHRRMWSGVVKPQYIQPSQTKRWCSYSEYNRRGGYNRPQKQSAHGFDFGNSLVSPEWKNEQLVPIVKDFYQPSPTVAARSEEEIRTFYDENQISIKGHQIPRPIRSFSEAGLPDTVMKIVEQNGWSDLTPIQALGFPMVLSGRDVVGIAQTGSGKTAAFILPALVHIQAQPRLRRGDGPIGLVVVPTRELANQVAQVASQFGRACRIRNTCVYGGASKRPQINSLDRGSELCIATPGRLLDLLQSGDTNLQRISFLVMDEADRMLDMGFEPQIRKIVEQIRPDRQVAMFSATWPRDVRSLAEDFLTDYVQVTIGRSELHANPDIHQTVLVCERYDKIRKFQELLSSIVSQENHKTIIFTATKREADRLAYKICDSGSVRAASIHGDKSQSQRDAVLRSFRTGRCSILVATDVAARGLDVTDITNVINYDCPMSGEDYIHRIGRTARAGRHGFAYTLVSPDDAAVSSIVDVLKASGQQVSDELKEVVRSQGHYKKKQRRHNNYRERYSPRESYKSSPSHYKQHSHYNSNDRYSTSDRYTNPRKSFRPATSNEDYYDDEDMYDRSAVTHRRHRTRDTAFEWDQPVSGTRSGRSMNDSTIYDYDLDDDDMVKQRKR